VLTWTVHVKIQAYLGALGENDVPTHFIIGDVIRSLAGSNAIPTPNAL
jgi:hypothetical protein